MVKKYDNPWNLTPQQSATMDAVCTHGCQKTAAKALGLSIKTVEQHTWHAAQSMGLAGNRLRKYIEWDRWMQRREGAAS
jgi:FixJ family two-component response regulator